MGLFSSGSKKTSSFSSSGVTADVDPYFQRAFKNVERNFNRGTQAYGGPRVAGFSPETEQAFALTKKRTLGNMGYLDQAMGELSKTAKGREYAPAEILDLIQSGGQQAANQAIGTVNHAAMGSNFGSPLHSALASRAAGEAVSNASLPTLANLYQGQQDRQEAAIRDMPGMYQQTATAPGDILRNIGLQREDLQQRQYDADRQFFEERELARAGDMDDYLNRLLGLGQMFRTQTATSKTKGGGKSLLGKIAPIAGAAIGGVFGGPAGAALGSQVGGAVG